MNNKTQDVSKRNCCLDLTCYFCLGADGQYEYAATGEDAYFNVYPEAAEVTGGECYADDAGQWESYAGVGVAEQQWASGEGNYPGEVTEYQHPGSQEGYKYPVETVHHTQPSQTDASSNFQQESTKSNVGADPLAQITANSNVGDLVAAIAASGNSNLIEALAAAAVDKNVLVSLLGKQLSEAAKKNQPPSQPEQLGADPDLLPQSPQKPFSDSSGSTMQRERQVEKIKKEQHLGLQSRKSSYYEAKAPQQKPLKSILKKGNPVPLKPPTKSESSSVLTKSNPGGISGTDHVGPEYIVCVSKSGPECFFCKLCQCHIESPTARELHVNSMKHIELFVQEKATLLNAVVGEKTPDEKAKFQEETTKRHQEDSSTRTPGLSTELERPLVQRQEERVVHQRNTRDYQHQGRKDSESSFESRVKPTNKPTETPEDIDERNRLMDYDRLRLREWQLRELSDPSLEAEKDEPAGYGIKDERSLLNEHERPRKDNQSGYDKSRQPDSQEDDQRHYEKLSDRSDYKRPTRIMSDDVGKRRSNESIKQSSNLERLHEDAGHMPKHTGQGEQRGGSHKQNHRQDAPRKRTAESRTDITTIESKRPRNDRPSSSDRDRQSRPSSGTLRKERRLSEDTKAQEESNVLYSAAKDENDQGTTNLGNTKSSNLGESASQKPEEKQVENLDKKGLQGRPTLERKREGRSTTQPSHGFPVVQRIIYDSPDPTKTDSRAQKKGLPSESLAVAPGHHTSTSQPQEMISTISTVIQGHSSTIGRRVAPPPPPYNKGTGPQSFRGRGQYVHNRGAIQPHRPPIQPSMTMANAMQQSPFLSTPHINQRPPVVRLPYSDAASRGPPKGHYPSRGVSRGHPGSPSHLSIGRAQQPTFYGRGMRSHIPQGRGIGTAQFPVRGRAVRGFRGQRW